MCIFVQKKNEERNINTIGYNEFISTNKEFVYMLPTIIEKTQPISGATTSSPSNPGLVPYIPAGADGYLHTSGEFKPIAGTGENKYFSPQLDYDNVIVIEKYEADLPNPPATEAEELRFNEFVAPSNGQLIPYGASSTTTGLWLGYWGYIVPADGSPELKINFSGPRLPQYTNNTVSQLHCGPYTLSKGDKFYMACNGAVAKITRAIYTFIPFKYQNVSDITPLNAYYSTEIDWEQNKVVYSISATESNISNDTTVATYTATANGMISVYVQSTATTETKSWAGFLITITTTSGKIIKFPSNAVRSVTGTALLQTISINKGDTVSVIVPASYTNVEIGNISFVPFKYQKTNVTYRDRVVRRLGEIFVYAGTDIPDNSLPLDGQIITECDVQYPDFYTWIINNAKTITLTEYETKISQYGHFGLDATAKIVRLPKIKAFIQNAESVSKIAEVENAGLPNITGSWVTGWQEAYIPTILTDGAIYTNSFEAIERIGDKTNTNVNDPYRVNFDASRSNIIYGNSITVTPDNVKYRYFICTKNEFKETFNSQLIEGRRELDRTNKITISIPQTTTPTAGNTATFLDYTAPDNGIIIIHTLQSESTGYNLTGFDTKIIPYDDPNNTLNIGFTGVYSTPGETNKSGSNIEKYYELNKGDIIRCTLQSNYNSINSGGAYFIPYKYKELPYTQYTQGELAVIASDASAPGDTFIDISVTDTDFSYTCPENGLFSFEKKAAKISEWVLVERQAPSGVIVNTSSRLSVTDHDNLTCSIQAAKGDIIKVTDRLTGAFNRCRFIPNKGSGKLYSETYTKNELEQISTHAIMPVSDRTKYTTYSVTPVNGSLDNLHTAPVDGYVRAIVQGDETHKAIISVVVYTEDITNTDIQEIINGAFLPNKEVLSQSTEAGSIRARIYVPVSKNQKFMLWFNTVDTIIFNDYSFIPCNGA